MEKTEQIKTIQEEINFWTREMERCKNDQNNQTGYNYYSGFVDGMQEILTFIEKGKMQYKIDIDNQIKKGLCLR